MENSLCVELPKSCKPKGTWSLLFPPRTAAHPKSKPQQQQQLQPVPPEFLRESCFIPTTLGRNCSFCFQLQKILVGSLQSAPSTQSPGSGLLCSRFLCSLPVAITWCRECPCPQDTAWPPSTWPRPELCPPASALQPPRHLQLLI